MLCSVGAIAAALSFWFTKRKSSNLILDPALVATKVPPENSKVSGIRVDFDLFDIIIVGGGESQGEPDANSRLRLWDSMIGTAGCVLASRLSEEPSLRVLLIEAGGRSALIQFKNRLVNDLLQIQREGCSFVKNTSDIPTALQNKTCISNIY